jgi:hypothetical protein
VASAEQGRAGGESLKAKASKRSGDALFLGTCTPRTTGERWRPKRSAPITKDGRRVLFSPWLRGPEAPDYAMIRAADEWRGPAVGAFEGRQLEGHARGLDRAHAERTAPARPQVHPPSGERLAQRTLCSKGWLDK